jgi:hypothetical protein
MAEWEQWDTLHGAEDTMVEGLAEAEDTMQENLNKAALVEGISLIGNIALPNLSSIFKLGGVGGEFVRGLINKTPGLVKDVGGVYTRMTVLEALLKDLPFFDREKK